MVPALFASYFVFFCSSGGSDFSTAPSTPLTKEASSGVANFLVSSMASLIETLRGIFLSYSIS